MRSTGGEGEEKANRVGGHKSKDFNSTVGKTISAVLLDNNNFGLDETFWHFWLNLSVVGIINRPGVARAVLQTPLQLSDSGRVSWRFTLFLKYLQNTFTHKPY